MNAANFLAQLIRGWIPEEPKMPKKKLKQLRTPLAVLAVASTVFSLFSYSLFLSPQTAALVPPPLVVPSAPNSSYVELTGVAGEESSLIMVLLDDGHQLFSENLTVALSITEKGGDACTAWIAVESDSFSKEVSVDGTIVDGNLVIDSRKSLFMVNPNLSGGEVVLTETDDWKLYACVGDTERRFSTAVEPYIVTAVGVSASASRTEKGWPLSLQAGYDPNTGILIYSSFSISDVLLEKLGIDLLIGRLELASYSENLNLEVANRPQPSLLSRFGSVLAVLLVFAPVTVPLVGYLLYRRRKRTQLDASNISEWYDDSTQNCDGKGW